MSIQRRLMKPGKFTIKLREDTPYRVFGRIAEGDHIVVTPTRLLPIDGYSDADILAAADHTLVITKFTPPGDIEGADLTWWMGTPRGLGAGTAGTQGLLTTPVTQSAATLSTWVSALCPPSLTVGTVTNGALPTLTASYQGVTRREALDAVCRAVGAEYRVNPDFTIDAAAPTTLFTSTPEVVVTRKGEGRDTGREGIDGSVIATTGDIEDFTSKAIVVTKGQGSAATFTTVTGSQLFRDGRNNLVHMERYIDVPTEVAGNASLIGTAVINKYNAKRRDLRLSSNTYNVTRMVEPGDYVYVYDPLQGLTDPANQIIYRDEVMSPLMLRVYGLTIPVQNGMGVYLRKSNGSTYDYVDLTDVVVWETGEVSWEVGAVRRGLGTGQGAAAVEGTVAYLGSNPPVAARVAATAGYIGRGGGFTSQTGITAATDLTDCSVAFTAPAGRLYRISAQCRVTQQTSTSTPELEIVNAGGTVLDRWSCTMTAGTTDLAQVFALDAPSAGAVTYKLRLKTGVGTVDTVVSTTQPSRILVEDIGPA